MVIVPFQLRGFVSELSFQVRSCSAGRWCFKQGPWRNNVSKMYSTYSFYSSDILSCLLQHLNNGIACHAFHHYILSVMRFRSICLSIFFFLSCIISLYCHIFGLLYILLGTLHLMYRAREHCAWILYEMMHQYHLVIQGSYPFRNFVWYVQRQKTLRFK